MYRRMVENYEMSPMLPSRRTQRMILEFEFELLGNSWQLIANQCLERAAQDIVRYLPDKIRFFSEVVGGHK